MSIDGRVNLTYGEELEGVESSSEREAIFGTFVGCARRSRSGRERRWARTMASTTLSTG